MLRKLFQWPVYVLVASTTLWLAGCENDVTQEDVRDAEENVQEEQQDVAEAQREGSENVREEQREAQQEINAAKEQARETIAEEQQDVAEAQKDLNVTEQKYDTQEARDAYALDVDKKLSEAKAELEKLKTDASTLEGDAKTQMQARIDSIQKEYDDAADKLDELKAADADSFTERHAEMEKELTDLFNAIEP